MYGETKLLRRLAKYFTAESRLEVLLRVNSPEGPNHLTVGPFCQEEHRHLRITILHPNFDDIGHWDLRWNQN